nr:polysaccharide deacetylase family protein [Nitrospirota bacterium]
MSAERDAAATCSVVMYHYVRDVQKTAYPGIKALSVEHFEQQLDWLTSHYRIIDYPTFHAAVVGDLVLDHPTAILTFDDGLTDHYETVLPRLRQRGLTGVFYVPTGCFDERRMLNVHKIHYLLSFLGAELLRDEVTAAFERRPGQVRDVTKATNGYRFEDSPDAAVKRLLNYEVRYEVADAVLSELFAKHLGDERESAAELYCSKAMLKEMADAGMTLGGHTRNHRVLSRLSPDEQRREVAGVPAMIGDLCGQRLVPFCFPYGLAGTYGTETLRAIEEEGYASAVTIVAEPVRFGQAQRFELPRLDTRDIEDVRLAEKGAEKVAVGG